MNWPKIRRIKVNEKFKPLASVICEYPDSNKINILPYLEIYESSAKVDYYKGEENVKTKWPYDIVNKQ
jgi:hypothetical protein